MTKGVADPNKRKTAVSGGDKGETPSDQSDALFHAGELMHHARNAWEQADWAGLADLATHPLHAEPERARLALLAAAGAAQQGAFDEARRMLAEALSAGCSSRLASQVLVSGAYNSLGRAALAYGDDKKASSLFRTAFLDMEPDKDRRQTAAERRRDIEARRLRPTPPQPPAPQPPEPAPQTPEPAPLLADMARALEALKDEIAALRERQDLMRAPPQERLGRKDIEAPFVVVIAGVPRSGSTWLFNAVRMLCAKSGLSCYSAWHADYDPTTCRDHALHLVKLHAFKDLTFPYHRILTTKRDLADRLASLIRMGWLKPEKANIQDRARAEAELYARWAALSDFEAGFTDIEAAPVALLKELSDALDIACDSAQADQIATALKTLPTPKKTKGSFDHDAETLLHPNHRASAAEREDCLSLVRQALIGIDIHLSDKG